MSEEFEDVAVVETAPVESAVPVDTGVAYVPEALPSEVEATELNLNSADDVLKNNDQQVYNEMMGRETGSAPITAKAIASKEEEKEEKKSAFFEVMEQQSKDAERRKELSENFGMSSRDLTKLLDFISNPELQAKLKDKLVKNGMSKERAEKTLENMNEFKKLKDKQDSGQALTDEEKAHLVELRKNEDLKTAIQATQDMRNEMELKTNGAKANLNAKQMDSAQSNVEKAGVGMIAMASFQSYSDSGISTNSITSAYNVAAAANKNDLVEKAPEILQANHTVRKSVEVSVGMGITV